MVPTARCVSPSQRSPEPTEVKDEQLPALHGPRHTVPQVPQFALSAFRSTHAAPQALSPVPHDAAHWPELHT